MEAIGVIPAGDDLLQLLNSKVDEIKATECFKPAGMQCQCECSANGQPVGLYHKWGLLLRCPAPKYAGCTSWVACITCTNARKPMRSKAAFQRHAKRYHQNIDRSTYSNNKRSRTEMRDISHDESRSPSKTGFPECDSPHNEDMDEGCPMFMSPSDEELQIEKPQGHTMFTDTASKNIEWEPCDDSKKLGHISKQSQLFFHHAHLSERKDAGMEYLVKKAIVGKELNHNELQQIQYASNEYRLHMTVAHLTHSLSRMHHPELVDIIEGFYKMGLEDGYITASAQINLDFNSYLNTNNYQVDAEIDMVKRKTTRPFKERTITKRAQMWPTPVPSSVADVRRLYLDGAFAIVSNLPMPAVHSELVDHAYFSIVDCIRDFLSHKGLEYLESITEDTINQSGPVECRCQSNRAKSIFKNVLEIKNSKAIELIGNFLITWSDDCETHAMNKMHREGNGVWVKTLTIGTINSGGQSFRATFPIAVGKKGVCHDVVEEIHGRELNQLKSGMLPPFHIGNIGRQVRLNFELYATLQDQPERRTANKLIGGNSQYGCRWGVSADHTKLYPIWKACNNCLMRMHEIIKLGDFSSPPTHCNDCLNWNILAESELAYTTPPEEYPRLGDLDIPIGYTIDNPHCRLVQVGSEQYLKPFRLSYEGLRAAVAVAHEGYINNGWKKKTCEQFLKVECLNGEYIQQFLEHGINITALQDAEEKGDEVLLAQIREHIRLDPAAYEKCPLPALWGRDGINLTTHIDAIMHLIFLGIVKSVALKVQKWLTVQDMNASFVRVNAPHLQPFKSLNIAWLKVLQYRGGAFGGYVSENWLAFSRIMRWFYQNVGDAKAVTINEAPDGLPQNKWTKVYNQHWLRERDLDTKGYAAELSCRVAEYMDLGDNCPAPVPKRKRKVQHVLDTVVTLYDLLECVMSKKITSELIIKTEYSVRLFLSAYDALDTNTRPKNKLPGVVSKYNFCCLMNVPEAMAEFGPLRNLWEGEFMGEGILKVLKPLMIQGMKKDWQSHLLRNMMREKAFDTILKTTKQPTESLFSRNALKARATQFHKYDSQIEIINIVNCIILRAKKVPVSVILLDDCSGHCRLFAVAGDHCEVVEIIAEVSIGETKEKFGQYYYKFDADENKVLDWDVDVTGSLDKARIGYGIMLPLLDEDNLQEGRLFALVASNWKSLSPDNGLVDLVDGPPEYRDE